MGKALAEKYLSLLTSAATNKNKKNFRAGHGASRGINKNKTKKGQLVMKNKIMKRALSAIVAAARVRWLQSHGKLHNIAKPWRGERTVRLANIAEGTHDGRITKGADAAITERFLLGKIGSASDRVAVCGAVDTPIGVITDEAAAVGDLVNVSLFGSSRTTLRMVASGAITQGALLEPAASGRVQTLGVGVGTHHVVGRALDAASAAGDVIEVDPSYFLRVI
jgi:hypothetical protein